MVPEHHQQPLDMLEIHIFKARLTCVCAQVCVELLATPWTVACQTPLSMGFLRQEYWSRLQFPPLGDLPNPGIEPASPVSPALADGFFSIESSLTY